MIKQIKDSVNSTLSFIKEKQAGGNKPLDTGFEKLNASLLGGLEWNRILVIAALSGGGKSIALEQLKRNFIDLNKDQSFEILSFDWEMPTQDQILRNITNMTELDIKALYGIDYKLSKADYQRIEEATNKIAADPVFIGEIPISPKEIWDTVMEFVIKRSLPNSGKGLIITLDHTLLTKGDMSDNEKSIVDELTKMFVSLKKELIRMGCKVIIIILSQLNRDIESEKRVTNPLLHYPTKNDIFAASSVYYCADYVIISHKPSIVNGLKQYYGPPRGTQYPRGLPVYNPYNADQPMVYWHLIKNRFGDNAILTMLDNFRYSKVTEFNPEVYQH